MGKCEDCVFMRLLKGEVRGVMDCDPDEWYCKLDRDEFDEDEEDCPKFKERDDYA